MSKYFIDCEFDGHNGPLLSIAMVEESGLSMYVTTDVDALDPWVQKNVSPYTDLHDADLIGDGAKIDHIGRYIRQFMGHDQHPVIIADSPVDIARFCSAISTGDHGGWASSNHPRMTFEVHNVDCYPTKLPGAVQHNAWWDAMALRHKLVGDGERG